MSYSIPEIDNEGDLTSQEYVYARLRSAIMMGAIPTGASLTMRGLAEQLDFSPTPIREALRRLNSESAIVAQDNRRMLIPPMTEGRFEDLVATRITLECHAAARALPYVSGVLIDEMRAIDTAMDEALASHNYDTLTALNHDFHHRLYCANPDQISMPLVESIWLQLGPFQREVISELGSFYQIDRHKEILTALDNRDEDALVAAIRKDIEDGVAAAGRDAIQAREN
ncbi:GntR family transcriptional regulator [Falsihalocynthiibacter sp. SS001]|uniref:GntR family transcriptional regulator n=1 Tax=Falsihalocynthiibacter sp. SS001 TaxID=3349698 RepID=UPI0036D31B08